MTNRIDEYTDVSLEVGRVYYMVSYRDRELRYPKVEPIRYVEKQGDEKASAALFSNLTNPGEPLILIDDNTLQNSLHDEDSLIETLQQVFAGKQITAEFTGARKQRD